MKLRPFELGLAVFFGVLFVVAIVLLNNFEGGDEPVDESLLAGVSIWGTLPADSISGILKQLENTDKNYGLVTYTYVKEEDFDNKLTKALADQTPPDLLLMTNERLVEHRSWLTPIPYDSFPERDYRNLYIDGASIFTLSDGLYAYPIAVDPLVMYWNRDIYADNGLLSAPKTWEEVINKTIPTMTKRDFNRNINQSALAMGEYANIKNAFPIISMLLAQGGSKFVSEMESGYRLNLNESNVLTNTMMFYTNISNINNSLYSWNRSLPLDRDMFLREDLVTYFGFGSEGRELESKNPNLSFDIAEVPQSEGVTSKRTYGKYYGLFILKASKNKAGAYSIMQTLSSQEFAKRIADANNLAPVHRNTLQQGSNDVYGRVIYSSAINTRAWLNPDLDRASGVFTKALEDFSSNRSDLNSVVSDTNTRLQQIY